MNEYLHEYFLQLAVLNARMNVHITKAAVDTAAANLHAAGASPEAIETMRINAGNEVAAMALIATEIDGLVSQALARQTLDRVRNNTKKASD